MKLFNIIIVIVLAFNLNAQDYDHVNIDLLGTWAIPADKTQEFGDHYSSCWGYTQNGREYAIVGCANGTAYIDITDASKPVFVDFVKSKIKNAIWREYKTYKNYAYQVSDDGGPNHFDIVDLSYLPDSVHVAYTGNDIFKTAHTIYIDGTRMYRGGNMKIYDLSKDPVKPELLLDNTIGYVHDMFVKNDTVYASQGNNGLFIYEFKDNKKLNLIGSFTNYPYAGYNHSSILTPDGKTLIVTDEVPGSLPGKSVDVTDLTNPILIDTFYTQSGKATLHNPFLAPNNTFVMASYLDGIQVYDYADPKEIHLRGYFDTHWQTDSTNTDGGYDGAWSAYTELPSQNVIVVDITNGLYVLDASKAYYQEVSKTKSVNNVKINTYPNPSENGFNIELPASISGRVEVKIFSTNGSVVYQNIMDAAVIRSQQFTTSSWAKGAYLVQLKQKDKVYQSEQVIK